MTTPATKTERHPGLPKRAPRPPSGPDLTRGARTDGTIADRKATCSRVASRLAFLSVSLGGIRPADVPERLPAIIEELKSHLGALTALL